MKKQGIIFTFSNILPLAIATLLAFCKAPQDFSFKQKASGVVLIKARIKSLSENKYRPMKYNRDDKIWFKDSFFIEERTAVNIYTDTNNKETWNAYVKKYVFVDLPLRTLYEYSSFSDTATMLKSYTIPDSDFKNDGWDYFGAKKSRFGKKTINIKDTIINGIQYKRIKNDSSYVTTKGEKRLEITIGYLRCDEKDLPLYFEKWQSQKIGCPVVKVDIIFPKRSMEMSLELEHASHSLTPEEQKVFAAWEKNAKEKPAQQLRKNQSKTAFQ